MVVLIIIFCAITGYVWIWPIDQVVKWWVRGKLQNSPQTQFDSDNAGMWMPGYDPEIPPVDESIVKHGTAKAWRMLFVPIVVVILLAGYQFATYWFHRTQDAGESFAFVFWPSLGWISMIWGKTSRPE